MTNFGLIIYLLLPAALANAFPPILAKVFPKLNYPLDFYIRFKGTRLLGEHKTFRGLVGGVIAGGITYIIEDSLFYQTLPKLPIYYGFLIGFAALLGDSIKSLFKRYFKIKPGKSWFPFDQVDWIITSLIFLNFWVKTDLDFIVKSLLVGLLASLLSKYLGWIIKINKIYF